MKATSIWLIQPLEEFFTKSHRFILWYIIGCLRPRFSWTILWRLSSSDISIAGSKTSSLISSKSRGDNVDLAPLFFEDREEDVSFFFAFGLSSLIYYSIEKYPRFFILFFSHMNRDLPSSKKMVWDSLLVKLHRKHRSWKFLLSGSQNLGLEKLCRWDRKKAK